ncbi:hypothetical protein J6590_095487 [Homalodisca vitripennis]|nr:hypothetical protein J6590_095487 [Homalodisca vitripennis]
MYCKINFWEGSGACGKTDEVIEKLVRLWLTSEIHLNVIAKDVDSCSVGVGF